MFGTRGLTLAATLLMSVAVLYFVTVAVLRKRKAPAYVAMHFAVFLSMAAGFVYFRYIGKGPTPVEAGIGYTFLQFKLAKWASPFCLVLMGATFAYFHGKAKGRYSPLIPSLLVALIALGAAGNYRFAMNETAGFLQETGYRRAGFSALLHLRELANRVPPDDVIYVNFGADHEKLRQMIAYILYDKKLATDWTSDNYIGGHLPPDQRNIPFQKAAWVIDFADPAAAKALADPMAGNLILKRMPRYFATLASATGGHARETDGINWWNWTPDALSYSYRILGKSARLRFMYMSIAEGQKELKIIVKGKDVTELRVKAKDGWNEYTSPPLEVGESPDLSVRIVSEDKPVRISPTDSRMASFVIKNVELLQEDTAPAKK
jgi:hypothetical protein